MTIAECYSQAATIRGTTIKGGNQSDKQWLLHDMLHDMREALVYDQWFTQPANKRTARQLVVMFVDSSTVNLQTLQVGIESHIIPR